MTFFEYKTTLAKIETSNYSQLRRLHTKLVELPMDNFYTIHAINKTITKFKTMTTSGIIKTKNYSEGTTEYHFLLALSLTTSEEEIVSLITDFAGTRKFELPKAAKTIIHISTMLTDCTILDKIPLEANYYSIGKLDLYYNISLLEPNRLLPSVVCYLSEIKDSPVYNYFLNKALYFINSGIDELLERLSAQMDLHKKYANAINETCTILQDNFKEDN